MRPGDRPARRRRRRGAVALLAGAGLTVGGGGCGAEDPGTAAGRAAPADTLVQTLDAARYVSLRERIRLGGGDADDASFYLVGAAALGKGGEVFVLDAGNHRVFVFGPDGGLVRAFGREGQGPGEFQRARHLAVRGDSVLVTDSGNRVHLFRTDGTVVHTRAHLEMAEGGDTWVVGFAAAPPEGLFVTASAYFRRDADGNDGTLAPRPRVRAYHVAENGDLDATGLEWGHESRGRWSGIFWVQAPFAPRPTWTVDGLGRLHATDGESYTVEVYDADGTPIRTLVGRIEGRPLDDDLLDAWKEAQCRSGPECDPSRTELALSLPRPEFVPPIGALQGFQEGHLAVRRWDTDPEALTRRSRSEWDLFDPDGIHLGRVPAGLTPLAVAGTTLVALERGENDEPFVVVFDMDAPAG